MLEYSFCNCFECTTSERDRDFAGRAANEDVAGSLPLVCLSSSTGACLTVTGFLKLLKYQNQVLRTEVSPEVHYS